MHSKASPQMDVRLKPWKVASAGALSVLLLFGQTVPVLGNPTGGAVVTGSATITSAGSTLNINQGSDKAIINWQSFSINSGELTKFLVPNSSSATLNRVLGGNPSAIYGTLQSNGQLFLVNPNGIVVGAGGRIDTAGFLGSTLDVSNSEFLKGGDLHLFGPSGAGIDNQGVIHASGGDVYLIANQVSNSGTLSAPQGNVGLAAGSNILLQRAGDQHLFVQPGVSGTGGATGVTNGGTIQAATAELKAAGGNAYALAINNTGNIAATGFKKVNGQVYLTADGGNITNSGQISAQNSNGNGGAIVLNGHGTSSVGTVVSSGKLVAAGNTKGTEGGTVEVLGNRVGITDHGVVDVSGDRGGGTALIGGDEHGANPAIPDAEQTYVGPDAQITADALTLGNGGKIVLWGNQTTQSYGKLSVRGGAFDGNGGFVETSGLSLDARTVPDISAPHGKGGTWLLDPADIYISDTATTTSGFNDPFTISSGSTFFLNQDDLLAALISGNVTLDASGGSGGNGTITWQQFGVGSQFDISSIAGNTLTLIAPPQIPGSSTSTGILFQDVTITSVSNTGSLNLVLNSSGSSSNVQIINSLIQLHGGNLTAYGTGFANVASSTSLNNSDGIFIGNDLIDAQGGNITMNGKAGYFFNNDPMINDVSAGYGMHIDHSVVQTSGTGFVDLTGDASLPATGSTVPSGIYNGSATQITGIGIFNSTFITTDQGNISITGKVNSGEGTGQSAPINGINISSGVGISTTAIGINPAGSVILNGDTSGSTATDNDDMGVNINGFDSMNNVANLTTLSAGDGGSIQITGTGGTMNIDFSATNNSSASGIDVTEDVNVTATGSASITLMGTGGTDNDITGTDAGSSHGVDLTTDKGGSTVISSASGDINVTGTGGTSPTEGIGVLIGGTKGFNVTVQSTAGNINATGTGGAGYSGSGVVVNRSVPNYGIAIADDTLIQTQGTGTISLTGTGSANSFGVGIEQLPSGNGFDPNPVRPTITAGGAFNVTALSDTGIYLNAGVTAASSTLGTETGTPVITSGQLQISNSSITLNGGNFTAYGAGVVPDQDGVNILNSTINTQGGTLTLVGQKAGNAYGVNVRTTSTLNAGTGDLDVTTLGGSDIWLNATMMAHNTNLGSGSTGNPASVTTGALQIENSSITLSGGDLTGYGAGTAHSIDGVDFYSSSVNTQGGNVFLTGRAGFYFNGSAPAPGDTAGWGVFIGVNSVMETAASNQNITTGNIAITGDGSQPSLTVINDLTGVEIFNSKLSVVDGSISVTGNVNSGTSQNITNMYVSYTSGLGDGSVGVLVDGGTTIGATGSGSVNITGNTSGSVSDASGSPSADHDNSGVHITGAGTTIAAASGGINITGFSGSIINNTGSGASHALDVSVGPFQGSGIPTLDAGTGSLSIDPVVSGNGINVIANITAATTTLSDPGQEVDLFNNGSSNFGILNLIANTATIYQVAPIVLGAVSVNNLTIITNGDLTQAGPLTTSLLSAASGGGITLINPGNSITQLGPINDLDGVDISSGGAPLIPLINNSSQTFAFNVQGNPYTIDLTQINNIAALGITIQPIGTQTPNIGGGTTTGQQVATVLPVNNQVDPNPPSFDTTLIAGDGLTPVSDVSYNPEGAASPIFQNLTTLSGASSGDSDVGPGDAVEVGGGSVNSTKMPPAIAATLQGALNDQVQQDLANALQGH